MEVVTIREFNEEGLYSFERFLEALKENPSLAEWDDELRKKVDQLLFDEELTSKFGSGYEIDREKKFENRYEFGNYLFQIFQQRHIEKEIGMLSWMALLFFDQVCEKTKKKSRLKVLSKYRYIPEIENSWRFYRHLILTPILAWQRLEEDSILLLSNPLYQSGDAVETFMSRQDFLANDNMITVAKILYFDEEKEELKTNATSDGFPGSARRLTKSVVPQLSMNYDLYEAPIEQIINLLPDEFNHWKTSTNE